MTTADELSYSQALWYAWGRADGGTELTGPPQFDGGDRAFGFAAAWQKVATDYDSTRRGSKPSIRAAFTAWQAGEEF